MVDQNLALNKARPGDDDSGPDVVVAHSNLESALSSILGIELGKNISGSIFGSVDADAQISIVRLSNSAEKSEANAVGLELRDGTTRRRLLLVGGLLKCYAWTGSEWEEVFDYEGVEEPALVDKNDVGFTAAQALQYIATDDEPGYILGTTGAFNGKLKLVRDRIVNNGAANFFELSDINEDEFGVGEYVGVGTNSKLTGFPKEDDIPRSAYFGTGGHTTSLVGQSPIDQWGFIGGTLNGISLTSEPSNQFAYYRAFKLPKGIYQFRLSIKPTTNPTVNQYMKFYMYSQRAGMIFPVRSFQCSEIPAKVIAVDSAFVEFEREPVTGSVSYFTVARFWAASNGGEDSVWVASDVSDRLNQMTMDCRMSIARIN